MAGQIAELAHRNLPGQYKHIDPRKARIILVDAVGAVLNTFGDHLSTRALRQLHLLGVEVELETKVVGVDATGIEVETERGHRAHPVDDQDVGGRGGRAAAGRASWPRRPARAPTGPAASRSNPDCTLPGHPEIFAVGDMMCAGPAARAWPRWRSRAAGTRPIRSSGGWPARSRPGRSSTSTRAAWPRSPGSRRWPASASCGVSGFLGWLMWLAVHLLYLVGFKNRLTAVLHWAVSFLGRGRSERVSTFQQAFSRAAVRAYGDPFARIKEQEEQKSRL